MNVLKNLLMSDYNLYFSIFALNTAHPRMGRGRLRSMISINFRTRTGTRTFQNVGFETFPSEDEDGEQRSSVTFPTVVFDENIVFQILRKLQKLTGIFTVGSM